MFYSVKRSKEPENTDANTQYGFMCNQLGIILTTTSVAQTKGKIERLGGTFQNRVPQELRLLGIENIDQANDGIKEYIKKYNNEFAIKIDETKNSFIPGKSQKVDIDFALSTRYSRKVLNGSTIKFQNKNYAAFDKSGKRVMLANKQDVMIVKTFDGALLANYYQNFYSLIEIDKEAFIQQSILEKVKSITKTNSKSESKGKNTNGIMYQKKWKENSSTGKFSI